MSTSRVKPAHPAPSDIRFTRREMVLHFADGRSLTVPLEWFPRLLSATEEQRNNWQLIGRGIGIHWPDVDEDISVAGLFDPVATRFLQERAASRRKRVSLKRHHR